MANLAKKVVFTAMWLAALPLEVLAKPPNIVVVMSDDQDLRLGSFQGLPFVSGHVAPRGVTLLNHFATVAQCCPSRTSYLRGQAAHNTNMTHVAAPGGGYDKLVAAELDQNYLPHWLGAAGYRTEYIGKLMNGYDGGTYTPKPKGWDHTDLLLNPYTYMFNDVVMSTNGERPIFYPEFHQTDVIRTKAIDRLQELVKGEQPYYIQIAPAAPHSAGDGPTIPCIRHQPAFNGIQAPRIPNFNPPDELQTQKPSWVGKLPLMNDSEIEFLDFQYRSRLQALLGVDELVEDVYTLLEENDQLDNTYFIYTTDNGFHMGNHRRLGGKGFPYIEDTNIPMIITGPGIPHGVKSTIPSTHVDMAPTYLDIAGVSEESYPPFLDGRSLLGEWEKAGCGEKSKTKAPGREIINVEFWGTVSNSGQPDFQSRSPVYAFKALRIVDDKSAWLFTRWCGTNETELYDTINDQYELYNLALNPTPENKRIISRLNGILLVTKSCSADSCRSPWGTLQGQANADFASLQEAMDPKYDEFFDSLPGVGFQYCENYQLRENEGPYYPPESMSLGQEYRAATDNFPVFVSNGTTAPGNLGRGGTRAQRYATITDVSATSRELTDAEMGSIIECPAPDYCQGGGGLGGLR